MEILKLSFGVFWSLCVIAFLILLNNFLMSSLQSSDELLFMLSIHFLVHYLTLKK